MFRALFGVILPIVVLTLWATCIYIVAHFVVKYW